MFQIKRKKSLLREINLKLEQIQKEKAELQLIKKILEDSYRKVDISNLYVFEKDGNYFIVEKAEKKKVEKSIYFDKEVEGTQILVIDIFTKKIIYDECYFVKTHTPYLRPIISVDNSLLVFPDQKVPFYLLQQLFYKLNNISLEDSEYVKKLNYNSKKK